MVFILSFSVLAACIAGLSFAPKMFGRYWVISPITMSLGYFLLVIFPGILLVDSSAIAERALVAYFLWFLGSVLGMVIAGGSRGRGLERQQNPSVKNAFYTGNLKVFYLFVLLAVPAVTLTFLMLGRIPLLIGLGSLVGQEGEISMHAARQMNTLQHQSGATTYFGQGYLRQIYAVVSPIFCGALYIYLKGNGTPHSKWFLSLMIALLVAIGALNGQIWVSASLLIFFAMVVFFVRLARMGRGASLGVVRRALVAYLMLVVFVFAFRYLQFLQGRDFYDFVGETLSRIFLPGAVDLFGLFPERNEFRFGETWISDLSGMLPGSKESFAYEVHYLVHGGSWGYTLSPGIVASSYVNFGFFGVFVTGLVTAWLFSRIFIKLVGSASALQIALALYLSHSFMIALLGDIGSFVVPAVTSVLVYFGYAVLNSLTRALSSRHELNR